ncbi:hypothetical protein [Mesorhizobium sp.]|jgi:hypothetical protein|nr:hypothetical protein [Mesorhizobium sp.]
MRGLLMALYALDFSGHGSMVRGRSAHAFLRSTKTMAKTTTKTV